jgi:hypothetical protein
MQFCARGMIAPVDLGMAIQAGAAQQETVVEATLRLITCVSHARVTGGRVALLAQQGWTFDQQGRVVASMRPVTQGAILGSRRVFPHKGAAFFGMTGITGLIGG